MKIVLIKSQNTSLTFCAPSHRVFGIFTPWKMTQTHQDFEDWNIQKQTVHFDGKSPFFRAGEVRWAYLGKNIGTESVGKGQAFARPVLILKKVFGNAAIVLPLSSREKEGSYYFPFSTRKGTKHCALLAQIRYLDGKRVREKISSLSEEDFVQLKEKLFSVLE